MRLPLGDQGLERLSRLLKTTTLSQFPGPPLDGPGKAPLNLKNLLQRDVEGRPPPSRSLKLKVPQKSRRRRRRRLLLSGGANLVLLRSKRNLKKGQTLSYLNLLQLPPQPNAVGPRKPPLLLLLKLTILTRMSSTRMKHDPPLLRRLKAAFQSKHRRKGVARKLLQSNKNQTKSTRRKLKLLLWRLLVEVAR